MFSLIFFSISLWTKPDSPWRHDDFEDSLQNQHNIGHLATLYLNEKVHFFHHGWLHTTMRMSSRASTKHNPKKNWKTRPQPWLELSLWCPTWRPLPEPCESCQHKTHLNCNGHSLYTLLCLKASDYWIQRKKNLSSIVCYSMLHMRGVSILGLCDLMLLSKDSLHGQFLALTDVFMTWTWTRKSPVAAVIRAEHSKCEVN